MYEVDFKLHDAGVCFLDGDITILVSCPKLREPGGHEVGEVVLDHATAGHLDWK